MTILRAAVLACLSLCVACAAPLFGPRRTILPADGAAVLPARHQRGSFLLFAEFQGLEGRHVLLFDTGTDKTLLDLQLARSLGLRSLGDEPVVTATGTAVPGVQLERLPSLRLGEVEFADVEAVGLDLSLLREHGGLPIVGIAGCDLFRQCLLEIDYRNRTLRCLPLTAAPTTAPHVFDERSPWVTADLAGTSVRMLVDTGFQQTLALPKGTDVPFIGAPRAYGEIASIAGTEPKEIARLRGEMRLGELAWREPSVLLVKGCPKIGARLLRDTLVRLDCSGGRIWIERAR
ncbi:MAG: aspartyl protease family protein [Planctomycetota bacterium]